ncbi:Rieske (2Fe-2S) protein [Actinomadura litoris]|uniref:Rieske (2Fe-2S) protein n=1 Tax=Actinomadura litoris TaxID=2678616 RepID=UPI001FA7B036|nr:Rieske (2Fe-2S) protein [Actinomadura litoris]
MRVEGLRDRLAEEGVVRLDTARGPYVARLAGGRPVVHGALCPHRGGPLEDAYLVEGMLICSWHRSTFRAGDGRAVYGPACADLDVVPARFDGDDLVVEWPGEPSGA